jgi:mRNA interferase HigB
VRIFSRSTLIHFWRKHRDAEPALRLWFSQVQKASWHGPADVRTAFGTADFIADNRIVFDIKGNSYRLIVRVRYAPFCLVFIRFIGTHAAYDRVDAATIWEYVMIKPVVDDASHKKALERIEALWDAQVGTPEGAELDALATLVDAYERKHFEVNGPSLCR